MFGPHRRLLQFADSQSCTRCDQQVLAERPDVEMSNCNQDPAVPLQEYHHSTSLRTKNTLYISVLEEHVYRRGYLTSL